jgi:hypothetical protein
VPLEERPHQILSMVLAMNKSVPTVDLLSHRKLSKWRSAQGDPLGESVANFRVDLRVKLDHLAEKLVEMRKWLTERGCRQQVFHCVRVGAEAVIEVQFDGDSAPLIDGFRQRFGARS